MNNCAPETTSQWIGFCVWFLLTSLIEYKMGKREQGSKSMFELVLGVAIAIIEKPILKLIERFKKKEPPNVSGPTDPSN